MQVLFTRQEGERVRRYHQQRAKSEEAPLDASPFRFWRSNREPSPANLSGAVSKGEDRGWPWNKLLEIANTVLMRKHRSVTSLQRSLLSRAQEKKRTYDMQLLTITILKADRTSSLLFPKKHSLISLIGDSAISAHYRCVVPSFFSS